MKQRYFIPLLLVSALLLMLFYIALLGVTASWSFHFMKEEYGRGNLLIIRALAVLASVVIGVLALPLGFVSRKSSSLYGLALPILGLTLVINPWNDQALMILKTFFPEYSTYILSCWVFWQFGDMLRKKGGKPQQCATANADKRRR